MSKSFLIVGFLVASLAIGCKKKGDVDPAATLSSVPEVLSAVASAPASGESVVSLRLSGGHLTEPLIFDGTIQRTPNLFGTSTSLLAPGVDLKATNGDAVLKQFVISLETGVSGFWDAKGNDLDLVFSFPDISKSYSLRPIGGTGGVNMTRSGDDYAKFEIHFDASPTQIRSKDIVFRLEGVIEGRD